MVGIAVADSISIMERTTKIAEMMASADVIIEFGSMSLQDALGHFHTASVSRRF